MKERADVAQCYQLQKKKKEKKRKKKKRKEKKRRKNRLTFVPMTSKNKDASINAEKESQANQDKKVLVLR